MSPAEHSAFSVRRIVVTVDSSSHGRAAMEAAAGLAHRLHAELEALFVEDIDLFNLAGLAIAREADFATGTMRRFDTETLEAQLAAEARHLRRALDDFTRAHRVRSTFRVARGRRVAEVMAAAGQADLLIMGAAGHGIGLRFHPGAEALAAAESAPRSVLLLRSGTIIHGRPLVAYDGSAGADKALDAAAQLAASRRDGVSVMIGAGDPDRADALYRQAADRLGALGVTPRLLEAPASELDDMCRAAQQSGCDLLVIGADHPLLAGKGRQALLERIACPLLLVR